MQFLLHTPVFCEILGLSFAYYGDQWVNSCIQLALMHTSLGQEKPWIWKVFFIYCMFYLLQFFLCLYASAIVGCEASRTLSTNGPTTIRAIFLVKNLSLVKCCIVDLETRNTAPKRHAAWVACRIDNWSNPKANIWKDLNEICRCKVEKRPLKNYVVLTFRVKNLAKKCSFWTLKSLVPSLNPIELPTTRAPFIANPSKMNPT